MGCICVLECLGAVGGGPRGSVGGVLFFRAGICRKKWRCFTGCGSPGWVILCLYVRYFVLVGSDGIPCNVRSRRRCF